MATQNFIIRNKESLLVGVVSGVVSGLLLLSIFLPTIEQKMQEMNKRYTDAIFSSALPDGATVKTGEILK